MFNFTAIEATLSADPAIEALRGNRPLISLMKEEIKSAASLTRSANAEWRKYYNSARKIRAENKVALAEGRSEQPLPLPPTSHGVERAAMRNLYLAYGWLRFRSLARTEPLAKTAPCVRSIMQMIKQRALSLEAAAAKAKANVA